MSQLRPFYVTDCESTPFHGCNDSLCPKCGGKGRVPEPFIWGLYEGRSESYDEFKTGEEMIEKLSRIKTTVYAHNGGRFDYHYLRDHINSDEKIMVINGRLAKFKIGECEFRDSVNILPVRLKDFQKTDIDYNKLEPEVRAQHMDEIRAYLRSDCVNLWELVDQYFKRFGRGLTQAGASMKVWSKMSGLKAPSQSARDYELYRPFYYGGRVQCFASGYMADSFSVVDINSAYPYAMKQKHPFADKALIVDELPKSGEGLEQCMIQFIGTSRGALPWRDPDDEMKSLIFPDDEMGRRARKREYFVTGWELAAGLELDAIKIDKIKTIYRFPLTLDFNQYVEHFYQERLRAKAAKDKAGDIFAKLFMNSLYGKFGANPENYNEYLIAHDDDLYAGKEWCKNGWMRYKPWGKRHLLMRPLPEEKHRYYNIATAASITGWVRAFLFRSMSKCSGLIYCDTDSLAARDVSGLEMGNALGQWKLENVCDAYAVAGKKLYAFHDSTGTQDYYGLFKRESKTGSWKIACKGVNLSPHRIIRVANGKNVEYYPEVPTYSITRDEPRFIPRLVKNTAARSFPSLSDMEQ